MTRKLQSLLVALGTICIYSGIAVAQEGNIDRWERRELRLDRREIRETHANFVRIIENSIEIG